MCAPPPLALFSAPFLYVSNAATTEGMLWGRGRVWAAGVVVMEVGRLRLREGHWARKALVEREVGPSEPRESE
eukprot:1715706-Rhodomonas_salina.1